MKLHRFIGDFDLSKKGLIITDSNVVAQIRRVLRLRVGDQISLGDGRGNEALVQIKAFKKGVVEVDILKVSKSNIESQIGVLLYCSILKRSNFDLVVQKATEVGVKEIVPLICKRTVKLKIRIERLEKIIREAAEQSGRGELPKLCEVMKFEEAIMRASDNDANFFFDKSGVKLGSRVAEQGHKVGIFIGPEGGWEDSEIQLAKEKGFKIVNLGKLTLRSETAAIIASYLLVSASN